MIRPATPQDANALAMMWNPLIISTAITFNPTPKADADIAAMIESNPCFLVYDLAGIQGFATYSQFRGGIGYARSMEHTIILHPSARGMGVGRALLGALEARACEQGVHQMIAAVSAENPQGQAFHAAVGYDTIATIHEAGFKFDRYIDLILMRKFLP